MRSQYGRARAGAGRASTTANIEMLEDDGVLAGPFGDYARLPRSRRRWARDAADPQPQEMSA